MQPTKLADKVILVKLTMRRASLTKRDAYLSDKIQRQEGDTSLTVLTKLLYFVFKTVVGLGLGIIAKMHSMGCE